MAKLTGALLSFSAKGSIAKTMTVSKWRGVQYGKQYTIPSNPKSSEQTLTRNTFQWSNGVWKLAGTLLKAPWTAYAKGQPFTDRNGFVGKNVNILREETDVQSMIFSPGAKGGLPPSSFSAAGGSGTITGTVVTPTPPTGWTIAAAVMVAIVDQNPQSEVLYSTFEAEDAVTPFTAPVISGLAAGDYVAGCFLRWNKPDGTLAYSASLLDTATVS